MWRQYHLVSNGRHLTTWLKDNPKLKIGTLLTLKNHPEPERVWAIALKSEITLDQPPDQRWHVGGL